jgi:hypothetical protein
MTEQHVYQWSLFADGKDAEKVEAKTAAEALRKASNADQVISVTRGEAVLESVKHPEKREEVASAERPHTAVNAPPKK